MKLVKLPIWKKVSKTQMMPASNIVNKEDIKHYSLQEARKDLCTEKAGAILCSLTFLSFNMHQLNKVVRRSLSNKVKDLSKLEDEGLNKDVEKNSSLQTCNDDNQGDTQVTNSEDLQKLNIDQLVSKAYETSIISGKRNSLFEFSVKEPYFVDKTMLIKEIALLRKVDCNLICGPRRWGKSQNLDMIYDYYGICQDIASPKIDISINPKKSLFDNTRIASETEFFNQHFGRYPVVYLDLNRVGATSLKEGKKLLEYESFKVIKKYKYLLDDPKLPTKFKDLLTLKEAEFQDKPANYLHFLCNCLKEYYGKECIILIDEFDFPITNMLQSSNNREDKKGIRAV